MFPEHTPDLQVSFGQHVLPSAPQPITPPSTPLVEEAELSSLQAETANPAANTATKNRTPRNIFIPRFSIVLPYVQKLLDTHAAMFTEETCLVSGPFD